MKQSQFVKMNDEELLEIIGSQGFEWSPCLFKGPGFWLKEAMGIEGLYLQKGAHGADLLLGENYFSHMDLRCGRYRRCRRFLLGNLG